MEISPTFKVFTPMMVMLPFNKKFIPNGKRKQTDHYMHMYSLGKIHFVKSTLINYK